MTGSVHERPAHDEPTDNMVIHSAAVRAGRLIRGCLGNAHRMILAAAGMLDFRALYWLTAAAVTSFVVGSFVL